MTKTEKIKFHKLGFLCNLMITELDDLEPTGEIGKNLLESSKKFISDLEPFIEAIYDSKQIRTGTYVDTMCKKIDTIVRVNFEEILD